MTRCVAIRFRWCRRHSDDLFVCFGTKPAQRTEGEISHETGSEGRKEGPREDRKQRRAGENSWLEIAVQRMRQSAEGGSEKMDVGLRREPTEVRKMAAKTCWPTEAEKMSALLVAFVEVSCKIHAKYTESCTKVSHRLPPSCAWNWLKPVFVLFFHPLGCALHICNQMCNTPGQKPLDESLAVSSLV